MIRILETGNLHLGREYKRQEKSDPSVARRYRETRMETLGNIVEIARERNCDYIVITGALFDSKAVSEAVQNQVCEILAGASCPVLVLPGTCDYCEENDMFWEKFRNNAPDSTIVAVKDEPLILDKVVFYPCICRDRYSEANALDWVKEQTERDPERLNIGIAQGTIEGIPSNWEKRCYTMTEKELAACGMDLWMIGYTHTPYPNFQTAIEIKKKEELIFNAGAPQPVGIEDPAEGSVFLFEIDADKTIRVEKIPTGVLHFDKKCVVIQRGKGMEEQLQEILEREDAGRWSIQLQIFGVVSDEEYRHRNEIYQRLAKPFLKLEILDDDLRREITEELIDEKTLEGTLENRLLKNYLDQQELLELAYQLIEECGEER